MDYKVCANCHWSDPFTGFCRWRNCKPAPFGWCPAWNNSFWISMLFSDENDDNYEDDEYECEYEKFLEKLMETP